MGLKIDEDVELLPFMEYVERTKRQCSSCGKMVSPKKLYVFILDGMNNIVCDSCKDKTKKDIEQLMRMRMIEKLKNTTKISLKLHGLEVHKYLMVKAWERFKEEAVADIWLEPFVINDNKKDMIDFVIIKDGKLIGVECLTDWNNKKKHYVNWRKHLDEIIYCVPSEIRSSGHNVWCFPANLIMRSRWRDKKILIFEENYRKSINEIKRFQKEIKKLDFNKINQIMGV